MSDEAGVRMFTYSAAVSCCHLNVAFARCTYLYVVSIFLCPRSSWRAGRVIPRSTLCVPNVFRSVCTLAFFEMPARLRYFFTIFRTDRTVIAVPYRERKTGASGGKNG